MIVSLYPENESIDDSNSGPINKLFRKLERKRPDLWSLVYETMKDVEKSNNLDVYEKQGWVESLKYTKEPLYEFRIPKTRSGGVVRLYFGYKTNNNNHIVILSGELKRGNSKPNPEKIKQAEQRFREKCYEKG